MEYAERDGYWVIQWSADWDPSLEDVIGAAPELVIGNRVAITSCDGGPYTPTAEEIRAGWSIAGTTAISKPIADAAELPMPGFDEWYVFSSIPPHPPASRFVDSYNFSVLDESDSSKAFWEQIRQARPLHVLGAGTPNMFFATRDRGVFDRVKALELQA